MKNIKELDKKLVDDAENWVANTRGGEMPDPDQKLTEKASNAAEVFGNKKDETRHKTNDEKIRDQVVVDDDEVSDQDTELDVN